MDKRVVLMSLLLVAAGAAGCGSPRPGSAPPSPVARRASTVPAAVTPPATTAPGSAATPSPVSVPARPPATVPKAPPATTSAAAVSRAGADTCRTLPATPAVEQAVTTAYLRHVREHHLAPEAGSFFYGACGSLRYAAARFRPTPDATLRERVSTQDAGAYVKVLDSPGGAAWSYLASGDGRHWSHPCTGIPQLPVSLVAGWHGCHPSGS